MQPRQKNLEKGYFNDRHAIEDIMQITCVDRCAPVYLSHSLRDRANRQDGEVM